MISNVEPRLEQLIFLPILVNSFLVIPVESNPVDRILSAMIGDMFMIAHIPRNGRAEYKPF